MMTTFIIGLLFVILSNVTESPLLSIATAILGICYCIKSFFTREEK